MIGGVVLAGPHHTRHAGRASDIDEEPHGHMAAKPRQCSRDTPWRDGASRSPQATRSPPRSVGATMIFAARRN
jgi:hypothetical protein